MAVMLMLPFLIWRLAFRWRPFQWRRMIFIYGFAVVPLIIVWDGIISCLRTRTPEELLALTKDFPEYKWEVGYAKDAGVLLPPVFLIGTPRSKPAPNRMQR
jgi:hypothetical protein